MECSDFFLVLWNGHKNGQLFSNLTNFVAPKTTEIAIYKVNHPVYFNIFVSSAVLVIPAVKVIQDFTVSDWNSLTFCKFGKIQII